MIKGNNLDRFYPRHCFTDFGEYYEVYDSFEHRVLETTSDWFYALERCNKYMSCGSSVTIQLSFNF